MSRSNINGRHYDDFDDRTYSQVVREVPSSNKPQSSQPLQTAGDKPPPPPCKTLSSSSADAMTGATSSPVPPMLTRWGDTTGTTQPARTAAEALPRFQYSPRTRSDSVRTDPETHGRHIDSPATQQKEDASAAHAASCDNLSTPQPRVKRAKRPRLASSPDTEAEDSDMDTQNDRDSLDMDETVIDAEQQDKATEHECTLNDDVSEFHDTLSQSSEQEQDHDTSHFSKAGP
ncbi:hypothetical protein ACOMHN_017761 [Nucella lapillus]